MSHHHGRQHVVSVQKPIYVDKPFDKIVEKKVYVEVPYDRIVENKIYVDVPVS